MRQLNAPIQDDWRHAEEGSDHQGERVKLMNRRETNTFESAACSTEGFAVGAGAGSGS